jgi:hypothetical protein
VDPGQVATVTSSTIYGEGNCLLVAGGDASSRVVARNTILAGGPFALRPSDTSCWYYAEGGIVLQPDYLLVNSRRGPACPGGTSRCGVDPMLQSTQAGAFDAQLRAGGERGAMRLQHVQVFAVQPVQLRRPRQRDGGAARRRKLQPRRAAGGRGRPARRPRRGAGRGPVPRAWCPVGPALRLTGALAHLALSAHRAAVEVRSEVGHALLQRGRVDERVAVALHRLDPRVAGHLGHTLLVIVQFLQSDHGQVDIMLGKAKQGRWVVHQYIRIKHKQFGHAALIR